MVHTLDQVATVAMRLLISDLEYSMEQYMPILGKI